MPVLLGDGNRGGYKIDMKLSRFTLDFLKTEAGSGAILALSALVAFLWANSPYGDAYLHLVHFELPVSIGPLYLDWPVAEWVKEGLMTVFFFVVGLEIKYEMTRGALSQPGQVILPVAAAIGGMAAPALVYCAFNWGGDLRGWSVPMATDIAFAVAVLAMVGRNLPASLRVFLLSLAIVDDLGAIIVIGLFYNSAFDLMWMGVLAGLLALAFGLRYIPRIGRRWLGNLYLIMLLLIWGTALKSGVGTSLAAVLTAFCVPVDAGSRRHGLLQGLMHGLHPFVAYVILPAFAFTAAGFSLAGTSLGLLLDSRLTGVALGLFAGKQIGVCVVAWGLIRLKIASLPEGSSPLQLYGVCLLCGIGFTMSLFLGALAFTGSDETAQIAVKTGVLLGSIVSGCAGAAILSRARSAAEA